MRIALLAPFGLRAKGTTRARTLPLAHALARRGHTVAVFIPPYDSVEDAGKRWRDAGVEIIHLNLPPGVQSAPWHWQLGWRLYAAAARWHPQVVHAFKPKGPSGLAATMFWTRRRGAQPRLVIDSDDWEGAGGWNDNPAAGYSEGQKRFFAWQEKYGLSHADAWTVTSACLRDRATALGARPADVHVLHNGVPAPTSEVSRRDTSTSEVCETSEVSRGDTNILLYTRFAGVRPEDVFDVWRRIRAANPGAHLTIAGRGLQAEERQFDGLPGVTVAGWLEPQDLHQVLACAAVAIAPWANTAANRARHSAKILTLMSAGVPVIAYDVGEMAATLGDAGVLVPSGDAFAFAAAAVALLQDEERRARLTLCARQRVHEQFSWDVLAGVALLAYGG